MFWSSRSPDNHKSVIREKKYADGLIVFTIKWGLFSGDILTLVWIQYGYTKRVWEDKGQTCTVYRWWIQIHCPGIMICGPSAT